MQVPASSRKRRLACNFSATSLDRTSGDSPHRSTGASWEIHQMKKTKTGTAPGTGSAGRRRCAGKWTRTSQLPWGAYYRRTGNHSRQPAANAAGRLLRSPAGILDRPAGQDRRHLQRHRRRQRADGARAEASRAGGRQRGPHPRAHALPRLQRAPGARWKSRSTPWSTTCSVRPPK